MELIKKPKRENWEELLCRPTFASESLDSIVNEVFDDIQINGDKALTKYTEKFDKVTILL